MTEAVKQRHDACLFFLNIANLTWSFARWDSMDLEKDEPKQTMWEKCSFVFLRDQNKDLVFPWPA